MVTELIDLITNRRVFIEPEGTRNLLSSVIDILYRASHVSNYEKLRKKGTADTVTVDRDAIIPQNVRFENESNKSQDVHNGDELMEPRANQTPVVDITTRKKL